MDLTDYIDSFVEENYGEVSISDTAYHFFMLGKKQAEEQMMSNAVDGVVTFDYYDSGDKTYGCIAHDSFCLEDFGLKDKDEVKVIVIKED